MEKQTLPDPHRHWDHFACQTKGKYSNAKSYVTIILLDSKNLIGHVHFIIVLTEIATLFQLNHF